jgi:hypothetical protein
MSWTCPWCGAAVDASADRCWGCKGPRSEAEPGLEMVSTPVSEAHREVAPAVEVTESVLETPRASSSPEPLPPPPEVSPTRPWTCSKCGETVDAGFLVCWSCGTSVEGVEDPSFVGACETDLGDSESQAITFLDDDREEPKPGPAPRPCTRCQGSLERGFIADTNQRGMGPSEWVAGTPQRSFWTGTWIGDRRHPIRAFRCMRCGHLEFWAGEPVDDDE